MKPGVILLYRPSQYTIFGKPHIEPPSIFRRVVEFSTKNADADAKDLVESDSEGEREREMQSANKCKIHKLSICVGLVKRLLQQPPAFCA